MYRIRLNIAAMAVVALTPAVATAQTPPPAPPPPATKTAPAPTSSTGGLPFFPLRVRWSADLDAAPAAPLATDNERIYVALSSGGLMAVAADTGAQVWRSERQTTLRPAAADDRVYIVSAQTLEGLDARTGEASWRAPLEHPVSAPLVARGGWVIAALDNGEVLALRGSDGVVVWRQHIGAALVSPPAINGDRLYLPGADGVVRALAVSTGAPIWTQPLGGSILTIAPLGARVYAGSTDNHFYCLDDQNGRVRWRWRAGADPVGAAIADEERVYFSSLDTVLRALDRGHGAQRWRQPLPWRPRTGPMRVGSTLVAAGIALDLRGYALETGKPVGEFALSENRLEVLEGQPVVVARTTLPGDFLVAALADGRLVALEHVFGLPATPLTVLPGDRVALTPPPPPGA